MSRESNAGATRDFSPRITLAVLAYNQSAFIDDAVRNALAQECEPIEIILSDDGSPDDTFDRMKAHAAAYRGPHHITLRRNEPNLGVGAHFNAVMQAARGELVVFMAGDDISLPHRVARIAEVWRISQQRLDLIACDLVDMAYDGAELGITRVDDLSKWPDIHAWARQRPHVVGAGHAYTRRLFERFGPLGAGVVHEDQVMTMRAICSGGAATIAEPLVRYRRGGFSGGMRHYSGERYAAWVRQQNHRHLTLHEQWLADARKAGCADMVDAATRRERERAAFLDQLLQAGSLFERLGAARRASGVALRWRLRKLAYWQFPGIAASIKRVQAAWKSARKR